MLWPVAGSPPCSEMIRGGTAGPPSRPGFRLDHARDRAGRQAPKAAPRLPRHHPAAPALRVRAPGAVRAPDAQARAHLLPIRGPWPDRVRSLAPPQGHAGRRRHGPQATWRRQAPPTGRAPDPTVDPLRSRLPAPAQARRLRPGQARAMPPRADQPRGPRDLAQRSRAVRRRRMLPRPVRPTWASPRAQGPRRADARATAPPMRPRPAHLVRSSLRLRPSRQPFQPTSPAAAAAPSRPQARLQRQTARSSAHLKIRPAQARCRSFGPCPNRARPVKGRRWLCPPLVSSPREGKCPPHPDRASPATRPKAHPPGRRPRKGKVRKMVAACSSRAF